MKALKAYVGLDNRFVLCEKFPDDEHHAGLNELLDDWVNYDNVIQEEPLNQGFYYLHFSIDQHELSHPERDMSDVYLVLTHVEQVDKAWYDCLRRLKFER